MSKRKPTKAVAKTSTVVPAAALPKKEKKPGNASGINSMTNWLLVLVLVLPVLISKRTADPVLHIRYIFLGCFMLLFALYFFVLRKTVIHFSFSLLVKIVFAAGIGFIVWNMVAMSSALNPQEGYYEIAKQLVFLIVLFSILVAVQREESQLLKLCKAILCVSIIQGLAGILQYYDMGFTEVPGANAKPYGLMANRNLFGSAQAFLLPFVMYVLYKGSTAWKYISGVAISIIIISLLLSQTRSAWLAAMAIIIISLLLVLIFSPANRKKWTIATVTGVAGISLLSFLLIASDSEGELKASITQRTQTLLQQNKDSSNVAENVNERVRIWKKTIQLVKDYPLKGTGPGNWKLAIPFYGTEGLAWASGKYSPDRPHNVYLLIAAETGIPGAVLYFGMWLLIAVSGIKVIIKPASEQQRILVILMLAGLAGIACDGMFSFPMERIEHSLYMLLTGGIILGSYASAYTSQQTKSYTIKKPLTWLMVAALLFGVFIGFKKYKYEVTLSRVKAYENLHRYADMAEEANKGKNLYVTLGADIGISMELKRSIALKELKQYPEALKEIGIAKRYHPNSTAVWNTEGTIYTDLKQYDKAIYSYQQAMKITPQYDVVLKNLGTNYFLANDYPNCIKTLEKLDITKEVYFGQMLDEAKKRMTVSK